MKKVKKIFAFLLAMTMTLAMGLSAFAAEAGTAATKGSITINNAQKEKTYNVYKIFDATFAGSNAAYTIESDSVWYSSVDGQKDLFTLTRVGDTNTYTVVLKEGKDSSAVLTWLNGVTPLPAATTSKQADSGTLKIDDLDLGYYLIVRTDDTDNKALTLVNVNGDVIANDKNGSPDWEKPDPEDGNQQNGKNVASAPEQEGAEFVFGPENDAKIGDTVYFKVGAYVPKYHAGKIVTRYIFTDTLDPSLELDKESIVVKLSDGTDLTKGTDYKVLDATDTSFILELYRTNDVYPNDAKIVITYNATVLSTAEYDNKNTISMTWKEKDPNPTSPDEPDPNTPEKDPNPDDIPQDSETHTYVYGFNVKKVDSEDKILQGAKFKLYTENGNTEIPVVKTADGEYRVAVGTEQGVEIEAGEAKIFGLKPGTYKLEETEAPAGYNKLTDKVQVTIERTLVDGEGILNNPLKVVNNTGAQLPETGGIGTTIFYVIGGLMMVGAAVLLVTRKKMSVSND